MVAVKTFLAFVPLLAVAHAAPVEDTEVAVNVPIPYDQVYNDFGDDLAKRDLSPRDGSIIGNAAGSLNDAFQIVTDKDGKQVLKGPGGFWSNGGFHSGEVPGGKVTHGHGKRSAEVGTHQQDERLLGLITGIALGILGAGWRISYGCLVGPYGYWGWNGYHYGSPYWSYWKRGEIPTISARDTSVLGSQAGSLNDAFEIVLDKDGKKCLKGPGGYFVDGRYVSGDVPGEKALDDKSKRDLSAHFEGAGGEKRGLILGLASAILGWGWRPYGGVLIGPNCYWGYSGFHWGSFPYSRYGWY